MGYPNKKPQNPHGSFWWLFVVFHVKQAIYHIFNHNLYKMMRVDGECVWLQLLMRDVQLIW